jgi:hypothetical protein
MRSEDVKMSRCADKEQITITSLVKFLVVGMSGTSFLSLAPFLD